MQLSELISNIESVVQDDAFNSVIITALINEAVLVVATGIVIPGRFEKTPALPDLYTVDTIDTTVGSAIASLPSDFNRDVIQVLNSDEDNIPIIPSVVKFNRDYPEQDAGEVIRCAVLGKRILYRDIPSSAETLTVHYYSNPETLSAEDDEPTEIPLTLHRKLIVGYVCREIFNRIEDGIEDPKTNTVFYDAEFQTGLTALQLELGVDHAPDYYDDKTSYCP